MNKDSFFQYVENTRDCDAALLNIAVQKGLRRAKSTRLDLKKLFGLAGAYAVAAALCIIVNVNSIKTSAGGYLWDKDHITQGSAEMLDFYAKDIADTIIKCLGDD